MSLCVHLRERICGHEPAICVPVLRPAASEGDNLRAIVQPSPAGLATSIRSTLTAERVVGLLIAAFVLFQLIGLDRLPPAFEDEPWIAEPGYRFWEDGVLRSELKRGFFGAEERYLLHAPLYSVLSGGVVRLFGPGLVQVRLLALAFAATAAVLTFLLGRRLLSPRHGLLAVAVLLLWRLAPASIYYPSGIPFVDLGRLARYDVAVPVWGLAGFLLVLPRRRAVGDSGGAAIASSRAAPRLDAGWLRMVVAGVCAGLAIMTHPVGIAWVAMIAVATLLTHERRERIIHCAWIAAGAAAALLPWAWMLADGWTAFVAQQQYVAERYDLLQPQFYLWNMLTEWRRYSPIARGVLAGQPGAVLLLVCGLTGLVALCASALRRREGDRVLPAMLLTGASLFGLGLRPKYYHYVAALWPLIAITAAAGVMAILQSRTRMLRAAGAAALAIVCLDGVIGWGRLAVQSASVTPYTALCDRLAAAIPPHGCLLAMPTYWLGLVSRVDSYRSIIVPVAHAAKFAVPGRSIRDTLDETGSDVILLDPPMLRFLAQADNPADPFAAVAAGLRDYLAEHATRRTVIEDPSYGRFEIYCLRPWSRCPAGTR